MRPLKTEEIKHGIMIGRDRKEFPTYTFNFTNNYVINEFPVATESPLLTYNLVPISIAEIKRKLRKKNLKNKGKTNEGRP